MELHFDVFYFHMQEPGQTVFAVSVSGSRARAALHLQTVCRKKPARPLRRQRGGGGLDDW